MKLRSLPAFLFAAALTVSFAKADTITINVTPVSGNGALTLTFDSVTDVLNSQNGVETSFNATGHDSLGNFSTLLAFYNPAFLVAFGLNPWDFVYDDRTQTSLLYSGLKMYSGDESNPTILAGTYNVIAELAPTNATVQISVGSPVAVTPEPSSLLLLGTGVTGVGMVLRRRFAL